MLLYIIMEKKVEKNVILGQSQSQTGLPSSLSGNNYLLMLHVGHSTRLFPLILADKILLNRKISALHLKMTKQILVEKFFLLYFYRNNSENLRKFLEIAFFFKKKKVF